MPCAKEKIANSLKSTFTNKIVLICLALSLIYFVSGFFNFLEIVVSAIAIICFFFLSTQSSLCILFFLHNFLQSGIVWDVGFTVTLVGFCAVTLIKYIIGLKKKKYKLNVKVIICFGVAFLISMLASINHKIYDGALLYIVYLPLIYFMIEMREDLDITQLMNYMLFGFILSNFMAIAVDYLPNYSYFSALGKRYKALTDNPNGLGMRAVFIAVFYISLHFKNGISFIKTLLIYLFCFVVTLATMSKTSLVLLMLFTVIFIFLLLKKDFKKNIKFFAIFLIVGLIVCLLCNDMIEKVLVRFIPNKDNVVSSQLSGRDVIWEYYWIECVKNPITILFGNGLLSQEVIMHGGPVTSHSLYLFLFYRFGVIGCLLLAVGFYFIIKELSKNKTKFAYSLPLIWFLLESLVENTFFSFNITFILLALLFMFEKTTNSTKEENKEKLLNAQNNN